MQGLDKDAPSWLFETLAKMESNSVTEVLLSRKNLGDKFARSVVQVLQKNTSVVHLDLSWNNLTSETTKSLIISLAKNSTLKTLNLNSNAIDSDGAKALSEALLQNKGLTSLKLSWNQLLDDGARMLASCLTPPTSSSSGSSSSHSSNSENRSTMAGIPLPASNTTLTSLELACNTIRDDGAKALFHAIRHNTNLVDLNLEWNEISEDAIRHGVPVTIQGNHIRSLHLFRNGHVGSETTKSIAASMQANSSLKLLSLSGKIGDGGSKALASVLTRHHLTHLHLSKCKIGDEGLRYLCTGLMSNRWLLSLHLSSNKIGNDGAKSIQLLLEVNAALMDMDLSANRIGDGGVAHIATALTSNFSLTSLNLQQNDFSDVGRRSMEGALTSNWSLVELKGMTSEKLISLTRKKNRATPTENIQASLQLTDWAPDANTNIDAKSANNISSATLVKGRSSTVSLMESPKLGASTQIASPSPRPMSLVNVVLHNNHLTKLPTAFSQLGSLKALVLSRNHLTSPLSPVLGNLTSLTNLDLRHNFLESLPTEIASLKSLTKLNASYNRLTTLPPSLGACTNLREVFFYENKLDVLPSQIARLYELKTLDLRQNPLKFVLESVFPSKTRILNTRAQIDKLFSYLTSLGDGEPTKLSRVKLMLVGDANVGKTSLRRYLAAGEKVQSSNSISSNVTTDGIEISDILAKKVTSGKSSGSSSGVSHLASGVGERNSSSARDSSTPTTFTTYDFAGQQLYYTTHQFFLSDKAIYLVVFSLAELYNLGGISSLAARRETFLPGYSPAFATNPVTPSPNFASPLPPANKVAANIEYWLKSIRVRTKYAPIVLVGTHLDEVGREKAEEMMVKLKALFKHYRIEEYFAVSTVHNSSTSSDSAKQQFSTFCSSKEKYIDLIPYLSSLAEQRRLVGQTVPHSCGQLINYIEEFRRTNWSPLMRFDDFKKVIIGYNTMDISGTLSLLNAMGYVLYYENDLNLRDIVILNPQSLANLMSSVITLKYDHVKQGRLSVEDFEAVYTSLPSEVGRSRSVYLPLAGGLSDHISKLIFLLEKFEVLFRLPTHIQFNTAPTEILPAQLTSSGGGGDQHRLNASNDTKNYTHVLVPCMLPSHAPAQFVEVQAKMMKGADRSHVLFSRTYKFQFMPFGFFSRLIVRVLNLDASVTCWGLWRDGFCLKEVVPIGGGKVSLDADYGCVLYDPVNYKMTVNVMSMRNGAAKEVDRPEKDEKSPAHSQRPLLIYPFLEKVIRAIDMLIDVFYAKEQEGMILENRTPVDIYVACSHCLKTKKSIPNQFRLNDLVEAFLNGQNVACGEATVVPVEQMIPDLIMAHLPVIEGLEMEELIGEGGFAKVFKANWNGLTVAVKELKNDEMLEASEAGISSQSSASTSYSASSPPSPSAAKPSLSSSQSNIARFKMFHHEVFMMSAFQHANLVQLHGITLSPLRIVMEYVPGSMLSHVIHRKDQVPHLTMRLKVKIALDVARAMACLHGSQPPVVHRDLRPQNIFVQSISEHAEVNAKVGDFGLAQHYFASHLKQFLGSFFWLAPEVLTEDSAYSLSSDVYSFAMVFWELLTQSSPFSEFDEYFTTREETLTENELKDSARLDAYRDMGYQIQGSKIVLQEFRKQDVIEAIVTRNLRPTIPRDTPALIKELITACWAPAINGRPTFASIVEKLERFIDTLPFETRADSLSTSHSDATSPPAPKSRKTWRHGLAAATLTSITSDIIGGTISDSLLNQQSSTSTWNDADDEDDPTSLDDGDDDILNGATIEEIQEELDDMQFQFEGADSQLTSPTHSTDTSATSSPVQSASNSGASSPLAMTQPPEKISKPPFRAMPKGRLQASLSQLPPPTKHFTEEIIVPGSLASLVNVPGFSFPTKTIGSSIQAASAPNSYSPLAASSSNPSLASTGTATPPGAVKDDQVLRPKRPPPQPLMSQQRMAAASLASGDAPTVRTWAMGGVTTQQHQQLGQRISPTSTASAPSSSASIPTASYSPPTSSAPKIPTTRALLGRAQTELPQNAMVGSASASSITNSYAKPTSSTSVQPRSLVTEAQSNIARPSRSISPLRSSDGSRLPSPLKASSSSSSSSLPSDTPSSQPASMNASTGGMGRSISPSIVRSLPTSSPAVPIKTSRDNGRSSNLLGSSPPGSVTGLAGSSPILASKSALSSSPSTSSPPGTSPSAFSKALSSSPPTRRGTTLPSIAPESPRNQPLPSVIHLWSRPPNSAKCMVRVATNNEVWLGSASVASAGMESASISQVSVCDNTISPTGSLPTLRTSPIIAMTVTEDQVWAGLGDGSVIVWETDNRTLRSTLLKGLESSPLSAILATPKPNDTMTVWTAHESGMIRQWERGELSNLMKLPPSAVVTSIAQTQQNLQHSSIKLRDSAHLRSSGTIGATMWFSILKHSHCAQVLITDTNLNLITTLDVIGSRGRIHNMVSVGGFMWLCSDDGIFVYNSLTFELTKTINTAGQPFSITCLTKVTNPSASSMSDEATSSSSSSSSSSQLFSPSNGEQKHHLVWAFSKDHMLHVYDPASFTCLQSTSLTASDSETTFVVQAVPVAKDRVLTLASDGSISAWTYLRAERLSRRASKGSGLVGSGRISSSPIRRPQRQAPSSPVQSMSIEFR